MNEPEVTLGLISNVWSKQMVFNNVGDMEQGHSHCFDHATLLAYGELDVIANGIKTRFCAPTMIWIRAGVEHQLVAAKAGTVAYCIHAIRNGERVEDIIDPSMIPEGSNPYYWMNVGHSFITEKTCELVPVSKEFL